MAQVIHALTRIQVILGIPDSEGNLGQPDVINVELYKLDLESFQKVIQAVNERKAALIAARNQATKLEELQHSALGSTVNEGVSH